MTATTATSLARPDHVPMGPPTLQWNRIARTVAKETRLDLWEQARLFGLLNMALTDGYIGSFEAKYHYNYWRPVTAIRAAATDGNPETEADPTWTPLRETPAIPDYDSGHAVEGGAAAKVLQRFFGTDHIGFSTCSTTLPAGDQCGDAPPVVRAYSSFSQAAEENGLSRILVGFHFREAVEVGIVHGARIGRRAVNRFLQPVRHRHHGEVTTTTGTTTTSSAPARGRSVRRPALERAFGS